MKTRAMSREIRSNRAKRVIDLFREVGTLLIAFSPLDASLEFGRGQRGAARVAILWFIVGICLFIADIALESG